MKKSSRVILSFLALCIFLLTSLGTLNKPKETRQVQSQVPSYTLSSDELYNDYETNEVAADSKYRNAVVIVTGIISEIGRDFTDEPYITLGGKNFTDGIKCSFPKDSEGSIANLRKGKKVTVKGKVAGKPFYIELENCAIK